MPFVGENITDPLTVRIAASPLHRQHVLIRPLSRPCVPKPVAAQHAAVALRSTFMPADYRNAAEAIRTLPIRSEDVWLLGYPGAGANVVLQELCVRILQLNWGEAEVELPPLLEQTSIYPQLQRPTQRTSWERIQRLPTTTDSTNTTAIHVHRSHLPYALLPTGLWRQQPRIIYVHNTAANRVASNYFRDYRLLHGFKGTAAEFAQLWRTGNLIYGAHTEHELAFEMLLARGLHHLHVLTFDENADEHGWQSMVRKLAGILQVHLDVEQCDEFVYWLRMELNAESGFRTDVLTMDRHFKRPQTQDFERTDRFDELE